jgi:hypothetical protein
MEIKNGEFYKIKTFISTLTNKKPHKPTNIIIKINNPNNPYNSLHKSQIKKTISPQNFYFYFFINQNKKIYTKKKIRASTKIIRAHTYLAEYLYNNSQINNNYYKLIKLN